MRRLAALALFASVGGARADTGQCHVIDVNFVPAKNLQIVAWVEDTAGHFVDTIFVTQAIGTTASATAPAVDFNSERRCSVVAVRPGHDDVSGVGASPRAVVSRGRLPERRGERSSHPFMQSSTSCTTASLSSRRARCGMSPAARRFPAPTRALSQTNTSLYPPRSDLVRQQSTRPASICTAC
jgi:hypothetical protein